MKHKILLSILATISVVFAATSQIVNIPDPVFKNFLLNHHYHSNPGGSGIQINLDANNDGEIQLSEATNYPGDLVNYRFMMNNLGISDLTGIEAFTAIKQIYVAGNQLSSLNLDANSSLEYIDCSNNPLTSFTINRPTLRELLIANCPQLTSLDIHNSTNIKALTCQSNPNLNNLNLAGCWYLETLKVNFNPLLTVLNFGNFYYDHLTLFQCYNNGLTSLNLSGCTTLQYLLCTGNQLTSLNLANGHMNSFQQISANGYPNLFCVQVDNVAAANFLWGNGYPFLFDNWVTFTTDCSNFNPNPVCTVDIPDANFKASLLGNSAINTNANSEIECTEAAAYTGAINVDGLNITDMTGIEAFTNLTSLSCNNQQTMFSLPAYLNTLNISGLTSLTNISCTGNVNLNFFNANGCTSLTNIALSGSYAASGVSANLSNCTSLSSLNLNNKNLNALNINGCISLSTLDCGNNHITSLDVSGCPLLTSLICNNNQLTTLNTLTNPNLDTLDCSHNQLTYLIVSLNAALSALNCSYNNLSYLDLYNNTALTTLDCSHNNLNTVSVNNNPAATTIDCSYNNLNSLNVNADITLASLDCSHNLLTNLNINNNSALVTLQCGYNNLPNINTSNNAILQNLYCQGNGLPTLDLSNNTDLKQLDCSYNTLDSLNLIANTRLLQLNCAYNYITTLRLRNDTSIWLPVLTCTHNQLTDLDLSNTSTLILFCDSNNLQRLNIANNMNLSPAFMVHANNNPDLECVQVDSAAYSNAHWNNNPNFLFDPGVSFSENCSYVNYTNIWADICYGNSYNFNGTLLTEAGIYQDTLTNVSNADSVVTLTLNILPTVSDSIFATINQGDVIDFNGTSLNTSGIYTDTLTSVSGCDSVVVLTLTVENSTGVNNNITNSEFKFYPNPTNGIVYFSSIVNIQVTNNLGQLIATAENINSLDISIHPAGIYFFTITNQKGQIIKRDVVVKK